MGLLTDIIRNKIEEKHADEDKRKANLRDMYFRVAFDPTVDDGHREEARTNLSKLLNPEARKSLIDKAAPLFDHLRTIGQNRGQLPTPQTGVSTPEPSQYENGAQVIRLGDQTEKPGAGILRPYPISDGKLPTPVTPIAPKSPNGYFEVPSIGTAAERAGVADAAALAETKRKLDSAKLEDAHYEALGKQLLGEDADPRDLAEFVGSKGTRLPARARTGTARPEQWELSDGTKVDVDFDPVTRTRYFGGEEWEIPEGAKRAQKTSSARPTIIASDYVTLDNASELAKLGIPFNGDDGKPLDLASIPKGMVLQKAHYADGRTVYQPRNINDKVVTVGNVVYAVNPSQVQTIGQGGGTALGQARTGSSNTPTSVQVDAAGVPHVIGSTTTPNTVGATPRTQGAPLQAAPAGSVATPSGSGAPAPPLPAGGSGRPVAVTPAMDREFRTTARSIQQALTQVVGDESNPNLSSLVSVGPKVLNDKKSMDRVGNVIRLMFGEGAGNLNGAHVSAGASVGPVSFGLGGFGEYLQQTLNLPAKTAQEINKNLQTAMKDMSPEERQVVASTISAFEESIAMRAINKSGVSNAQVSAIQNTLPLIGVNTFTKGDFAERVKNWAQQGLNGAWGMPPNYFRPGFLDRLKTISADMDKLAAGGTKLPTPDNIPTVTTKDQFNKLKSGDIYKGKDGGTYRKP